MIDLTPSELRLVRSKLRSDWGAAAVKALGAALMIFFGPEAGIPAARAETPVANSAAPVTPAEPQSYRTDDYRTPVPATLKGATALSSEDAQKVWESKSAIFVDVYPHAPKPPNLPAGTLWREPTHQSIEDAVWLPNVGYGVLSVANDDYFKGHLEKLTHGDKSKTLVFFCLRNCWMSWNAAKRALSYGYKNVDWYRDGSDGWQEIGGLVVDVKPMP